MEHERNILAGLITAVTCLASSQVMAAGNAPASDSDLESSCTNLVSLQFDGSQITKAEVTEGTFVTPRGREMENLPSFCRVVIHSSFSADSSVNSELWLPLSNWNKRFLGTGNGGMAGDIAYTSGHAGIPDPDGAMALGLKRGFAVANTDMGTSSEPGEPFAAIAHPVKWLDYGWRSTHAMTEVSKAIIRAFYGAPAEYSYFSGCSAGGFQSMRLIQDFPNDYDGFLTGHIGPNRSAKLMVIQHTYMQPKLHPEGRLSNDDLMMMHKSVLSKCAGQGGGVESDPFLSTPYQCDWEPESLLCESENADQCLTQAQVDMANRIYRGLRNPRTGEVLFPGPPIGSELGWEEYMEVADEHDPPYAGATRSILGPDFDFWESDWDRDVQTFIRIMAPLWHTTDTDLSTFRATGGKLLMFFGYNDTSSSYDTTAYYKAVREGTQNRGELSKEKAQESLQEYFRLFMMPGMEHCRGGNGPNSFDGLTAITNWVEKGIPPERITAFWRPRPGHFPASLGRPMTRPLCPYPQVAQYKGSGDTSKAENFVCK